MRTLVDDLAPLQHQDEIGPADLAEPVGDEERRSLAADAIHRLLDAVFGGAVDGAGAVIQDQDARIGQEGASDGNALSLAAGQGHAALADLCRVALFKVQDEFMRLSLAGGALDVFLGRFGHAKGDVLGDGARKEKDVLLDGRDLGAQRFQFPVAHVDPIDQYLSALHVKNAIDQSGERALSAAGPADDGHGFAGLDAEADIAKYIGRRSGFAAGPCTAAVHESAPVVLCALAVTKIDRAKRHCTLNRPLHAGRVLVQIGLGVDQFQNATRAGKPQLSQLEGEDGNEGRES